jgi:3-oxoacyl-[acyl-carrier-protein] synthase II
MLSDLEPSTPSRSDMTPWIGGALDWPRESLDSLRSGIDPVLVLTRNVAAEAIAEARLSLDELSQPRCGCVFGTSKGGWHTLDRCLASPESSRPWLEGWPSTAAAWLVQRYGITGPSLAPVAACATGLVAILRAAELVRSGECDVVLAGSADYSLHAGVLASFQRLGVLAPPRLGGRPFDRDRSGFAIGAGAGCCVLERASTALTRGAPIYATIRMGRLGADPTGITSLDVTGETLAGLIRRTIPTDVIPDLIHLHGTGTRQNDPAECQAVRTVFGSRADGIACTSAKGALGHLLGAAGSVETALTCLSLRDQRVPPSVNLMTHDPACALPFVTGAAVERPLCSTLKLSLGFGGHQAVAWLERFDGGTH